MIIETLSTFPHMYDSVMGESMMKRAQEKGILQFRAHDLRDWTHDRHRTTDDDPYGGGAGLVMKCEPIFEAVEEILGMEISECNSASTKAEFGRGAQRPDQTSSAQVDSAETESGGDSGCSNRASSAATGTVQWTVPPSEDCLSELEYPLAPPPGEPQAPSEDCLSESGYPVAPPPGDPQPAKIVFLAPQGRTFDDAYATELSQEDRLLFICGHYEGIDERVYTLADHVISLGDYVLTSGELASMVVIDAVVRKLPGALGAADGPIDESFTSGLLEYPQYTRPANFRGMEVPPVLLSGNHQAVARWRREESLRRTAQLRPDLLRAFERAGNLTAADQKYLLSWSEDWHPSDEGVS